jgi:hypothetical protein
MEIKSVLKHSFCGVHWNKKLYYRDINFHFLRNNHPMINSMLKNPRQLRQLTEITHGAPSKTSSHNHMVHNRLCQNNYNCYAQFHRVLASSATWSNQMRLKVMSAETGAICSLQLTFLNRNCSFRLHLKIFVVSKNLHTYTEWLWLWPTAYPPLVHWVDCKFSWSFDMPFPGKLLCGSPLFFKVWHRNHVTYCQRRWEGIAMGPFKISL